jgi:hypothetical protein
MRRVVLRCERGFPVRKHGFQAVTDDALLPEAEAEHQRELDDELPEEMAMHVVPDDREADEPEDLYEILEALAIENDDL